MNSSKKILFIGDALNTLKLSSDSSLALAEAALSQGHCVSWCTPEKVVYFKNTVLIEECDELVHVSSTQLHIGKKQRHFLAEFSLCFIRKDPPFDAAYKNLCWLLATEKNVKMINPPHTLLTYHEKSLPWHAFAEGVLEEHNLIPTCFARSLSTIQDFCTALPNTQFIAKPWLGHGGEDVTLFQEKSDLFTYLKSRDSKQDPLLVQPFLEEIHTLGDRRVLIANGKVVCHFVRLPAQGRIAANLAQGGSAQLKPLTPEQNEICLKLARYLQEKQILFAGIDLIGLFVSEINITSPTGLRTYENLAKTPVSLKAFNLFIS